MLDCVKKQAETIGKETGLSHSKALDLASRLNGFRDYYHALRETDSICRLEDNLLKVYQTQAAHLEAFGISGQDSWKDLYESNKRVSGEQFDKLMGICQDSIRIGTYWHGRFIEVEANLMDEMSLDDREHYTEVSCPFTMGSGGGL